MKFQHASQIWRDFPELVPGVLFAEGITASLPTGPGTAKFTGAARSRLDGRTESELPEIQAWRRAFARMGLKPTQYRCAAESLLRRFRKDGTLPGVHPLVDLCNAASLAFAIPVAVFDTAQITGDLTVRHATGAEDYLTFSGDVEHPAPGEVIFADGSGQAHARRWTNRQSGRSAVRDETVSALIVAEALHASAPADVPGLISAIAGELTGAGGRVPVVSVLSPATPAVLIDLPASGIPSLRPAPPP